MSASRTVGHVVTLGALAAWAYVLLRPRHLRWGLSDEQATRDLPGDDRIAHPQFEATRGVLIDAPPSAIWPWLAQLGTGRGGYYSYDRIDNNGRPSAREIIPELQQIMVGDTLAAAGEEGFTVAELDPGRYLVLEDMGGHFAGIDEDTTLAYSLEQVDADRTRLTCRMRIGHTPSLLASLLVGWFVEPGDFVMMRRQLLGIKQRAERALRAGEARRSDRASIPPSA